MPEELVSIPDNLTLVGDDDLRALETRVIQEFDRLNLNEDGTRRPVDPGSLEYMATLAAGLDKIRSELAAREVRAQEAADRDALAAERQRQALQARVHGGTGTESGGDDVEGTPQPVIAPDHEAAVAAAAARGTTAALVNLLGSDPAASRQLIRVSERTQASLAATALHAPPSDVPKSRLKVHAGVDIPGIARGAELSLEELTGSVIRAARGMPTTRDGHGQERLVATVRNGFETEVDDRASPKEIGDLIRHLTRPDAQEALVAGGGWCAPSDIRYDFFNVACSDGLVDLPTFGVTRGGIRFPTSPSLADVFANPAAFGGFSATFSSASVPWLWTETDDVATVTGTPNKPAMRVPCPSFNERRLECYGITLTAGNLTDDAYPEATTNFLRLLLAAHEHAMNGRIIATMLSLSSAVVTGGGLAEANKPVFNQVYGAVALAATDYRERFGMCESDVLEVLLPKWVREAIRSDLAWRQGVELLDVTNAQIDGYFVARRIRPQWVSDWQVRATGLPGLSSAQLTNWPGTVDFLIYAAGTFLLGNGLTLDLGVVRDSVLNAENDFTAAWSEECHLVALVGHAAWQYRVSINVSGASAFVNTDGSNL